MGTSAARSAALSPVLAAGAIGLAAIGILDCTAMQMLRGQFDLGRTALWCLLTLVPLTLAAALVAARATPNIHFLKAIPLLAGATFAVLALLLATEAMLFPIEGTTDAFDRARSKLPGAAAFVGLGASVSWLHRRTSEAWEVAVGPIGDTLGTADRATLANAQLATSAGNYVELHCRGGRTRLVRLPHSKLAALPEASGLVRLHRSASVRASAIAHWHNDRSGLIAVELDDGTLVRIGRSYRQSAYALRESCRSSPLS